VSLLQIEECGAWHAAALQALCTERADYVDYRERVSDRASDRDGRHSAQQELKDWTEGRRELRGTRCEWERAAAIRATIERVWGLKCVQVRESAWVCGCACVEERSVTVSPWQRRRSLLARLQGVHTARCTPLTGWRGPAPSPALRGWRGVCMWLCGTLCGWLCGGCASCTCGCPFACGADDTAAADELVRRISRHAAKTHFAPCGDGCTPNSPVSATE
jgi:hypothetical protein